MAGTQIWSPSNQSLCHFAISQELMELAGFAVKGKDRKLGKRLVGGGM